MRHFHTFQKSSFNTYSINAGEYKKTSSEVLTQVLKALASSLEVKFALVRKAFEAGLQGPGYCQDLSDLTPSEVEVIFSLSEFYLTVLKREQGREVPGGWLCVSQDTMTWTHANLNEGYVTQWVDFVA